MDFQLSIYSQLIVDEAKKRGIKVKTFLEVDKNLVLLKHKNHQEFIIQSRTNLLGAVNLRIISNKILTYVLLNQYGFPTPETIYSNSKKDIISFLNKKKVIVIKPRDSLKGYGVTVGISKEKQIDSAIKKAKKYSRAPGSRIIAQEQILGDEHRILVINFKHVFVSKRIPAHVVGDGKMTVGELIKKWNKSLAVQSRKIKLTKQTKQFLGEQRIELNHVPPKNKKVFLSNLSNLNQGGIAHDVTDSISKKFKQMSISIAKKFDAPVVGIDLITKSISSTKGKVIELNPYPGITIHHFPTYGKPRRPAKHIVDMLFPETIGKYD